MSDKIQRKGGVYVITNKQTGQKYVGQTCFLHRREREHFEPKNKKRHNIRLAEDIEKYGRKSFSFEVLEEIDDRSKRDEREIFWIDYFNSRVPHGYNIGRGGRFSCVCKISHETLLQIAQDLKEGRPAKYISSKYKISIQTVTDINVGRFRKEELPNEDFPLRKFANLPEGYQKKERPHCPACGREMDYGSQKCSVCTFAEREEEIYGSSGEKLKEELKAHLLQKCNFEQIGRLYGVSGNSIKKKMRKYKLI